MDAFGILVGHLVGDFVLQNDWLAQNKKRSSVVCLLHVGIYTLAVFLLGFWARQSQPDTLAISAASLLAIAVPHFIIDRWGLVPWAMQELGQQGFAKPPLAPWSLIVVDNTWHLVCLYILYRCLL